MEGNFKLIKCNDDDVIECNESIHRVSKLKKALETFAENEDFVENFWELLREENIYYLEEGYHEEGVFSEGMDAQILTLGSKSWKKGKLKFSLCIEFYAEEDVIESEETSEIKEPESPLDDLRRQINDLSS